MPTPITTTLAADKVTPGTVRFTEPETPINGRALSIYLPNDVVETLGLEAEVGVMVKLTIERA